MYKSPQEHEEALWRHFGEWGEVRNVVTLLHASEMVVCVGQLENVNVIHRLSICFVRYRLRSNAEFAKEVRGL